MRLPAVAAEREIAFLKPGVVRPRNLTDNSTLYDIADLRGHCVRALTADPSTHIGVERQVDALEQHLTLARLGQRALNDGEILGHRHAIGSPFQQDLPVHFRHGALSSCYHSSPSRTSGLRRDFAECWGYRAAWPITEKIPGR